MTTFQTNERPFFSTIEEKWMFLENTADNLYEMLHKINRDSAALHYIGESTSDLEAMRYLLQKCWQHYRERADQEWNSYYDSSEYGGNPITKRKQKLTDEHE